MVDHGRLHDVVQLLGLQDARVHGEVKQYKGDKDDGKSNKEVREKDTDKDDLRESRYKNYICGNTCEMFIREYWATASSRKGILVSTARISRSRQICQNRRELTFIHIFGESVENTTRRSDVKECHW